MGQTAADRFFALCTQVPHLRNIVIASRDEYAVLRVKLGVEQIVARLVFCVLQDRHSSLRRLFKGLRLNGKLGLTLVQVDLLHMLVAGVLARRLHNRCWLIVQVRLGPLVVLLVHKRGLLLVYLLADSHWVPHHGQGFSRLVLSWRR